MLFKDIGKQFLPSYGNFFVSLQMAITYDDLYLLTISEDSCLMIWKIIDKEGRVVKRDKELGHSEEILITKSDLQEKVIY